MYFQIFYHILKDYGRKNSKFYDWMLAEIFEFKISYGTAATKANVMNSASE